MTNLTDEEKRILIERIENQKRYRKKYYWAKKYGLSVDYDRCRDVKIRNTTLCYGVHPTGGSSRSDYKVFFANGDSTNGVEGWYTQPVFARQYFHVAYAEDLLQRPVNDFVWELVDPARMQVYDLHYASVAQVARGTLIRRACCNFGWWFFTEPVENITMGELMSRECPNDQGRLRRMQDVFCLYFEGIDVLSLQGWTDLCDTVESVLERGRRAMAIIEAKQDEIARRARWLRDRVANEFGFKWVPDTVMGGGRYVRGPVSVNHLGQVYIDNEYVCIVPVHGGHLADDYFPVDDIVAAKMAALATDERDNIYTIAKYTKMLQGLFKNVGKN